MWVLRTWTQVLAFAQQALYPWSHLPVPEFKNFPLYSWLLTCLNPLRILDVNPWLDEWFANHLFLSAPPSVLWTILSTAWVMESGSSSPHSASVEVRAWTWAMLLSVSHREGAPTSIRTPARQRGALAANLPCLLRSPLSVSASSDSLFYGA